jgi:hypothetical protein
MMVELKKMSSNEKFNRLCDTMEMEREFIIPFVSMNLGRHALEDLHAIWSQGVNMIPDNTPYEDRYEIAYGNWVRMAKNSYNFIRERMGDVGIKQFERAHIDALKKKNAGLSMALLKIMRSVSSGTAFTFIARQILYEIQWFTPYSLMELSPDTARIDIENCKILDFPDTNDLCLIGCQRSYPKWVANQLGVMMKYSRQNAGCICTLTPV